MPRAKAFYTDEEIPLLIRELRKKAGLTLAQMGEQCGGKTRQYAHKLENPAINVGHARIEAVEMLLGITLEHVWRVVKK